MISPLLIKALKFLLLLTLPLTLLPLFMGTLGGLLFPIFYNAHISTTTEFYLKNIKHTVSDWGVGGDAPTFNQFQDKNNRFHLQRINSQDWLKKLGFLLPREYSDINLVLGNDVPIDKQASLNHLVQDKKKEDQTSPKEQWLFLTRLEWLDWDGWNSAFDDFLQYAYTNPRLNETVKFHFAECSAASTASFLCNVWNTRSPALVHFLVEEEDAPPLRAEGLDSQDLTYAVPVENLRPVTVRIIELGLQEAYTGHPWTTFPSKLLQFHSIIAKDGMYQQFPPYTSPEILLFKRFNEYMDRLLDAPNTLLNHICELDWWIYKNINQPLKIEELITFLHSTAFQTSLIASTLIDAILIRPIQWAMNEFLGTPKPGDVVFAGMEFDDDEEEEGGQGENDDIFGFGDMFRKMDAEMRRLSSEAARTAEGGNTVPPPPETTSVGRG